MQSIEAVSIMKLAARPKARSQQFRQPRGGQPGTARAVAATPLLGSAARLLSERRPRGRGYARTLLAAFIKEARGRGVRLIWVASYDFQAPGMYEKAGFERVTAFEGWPEDHVNVVLCKTL